MTYVVLRDGLVLLLSLYLKDVQKCTSTKLYRPGSGTEKGKPRVRARTCARTEGVQNWPLASSPGEKAEFPVHFGELKKYTKQLSGVHLAAIHVALSLPAYKALGYHVRPVKQLLIYM